MTSFRADAIANFTYVVTLTAPVVAYLSFKLVRSGQHQRHRAVQATLLGICWLAVLLLETKIRLSGGSGSLVANASDAYRPFARGLLAVHISGAVITYLVWSYLVVVSWRRFTVRLPGDFSLRHRQLGRAVFYGLCFTAVSATGMYFTTFVL